MFKLGEVDDELEVIVGGQQKGVDGFCKYSQSSRKVKGLECIKEQLLAMIQSSHICVSWNWE